MRPRELTVEGFRSHRARATFDFRDRRLIGIVGPIGAGKSSLLDAVVFALYGKTPAFEKGTRSLIHQLADTAHVQLVFEVDAQLWRATRAIRRKGQSQHKLERLDADGTVLETIVQEAPVRARVEQILGLNFAAFCRSVLLAQGRFAEFLKATDVQRTEVLKGVFGYRRFDAALVVAKERAAHAEGELAALSREGEDLARARASLEEARERAVQAAARHTELEAAAARCLDLAERLRAAEAEGRSITARQEELAELAAGLPDDEEVAAATDLAERGDEEVGRTEAESTLAEEVLRGAETTLTAVAERVGGRAAVADLAEVVARMEREAEAVQAARQAAEHAGAERADAERLAADAAAQRDVAAQEEHRAEEAAAAAREAVRAADEALHAARHAEMAASLRGGLVTGEPCPVCAQAVTTLPPAPRGAKVPAAERALERARAKEDGANAALADAQRAASAASARAQAAAEDVPRRAAAADAATERASTAAAALEATRSEVVDRLGEGDPYALVRARQEELDEAERLVQAARVNADRARAALDGARRDRATVDERLDRIRTAILTARGRLGHAGEVGGDPAAIREAHATLREALGEERERLATREADAVHEVGAVKEALAGERARAGLDPDADIAEAAGAARGSRAAAEQRVADLEDVLARGSDLEARLGAAVARRDLASRLTSDLQPSRFLGFVLEEERRALAELGSVHLDALTDGAYRFTEDDRFDVVDINAGASQRSADSLSGGETFLAALALALALAEMVARGGGRLDSFFLDEGFGNLDAEHLDRAMDGIARLVAGGSDRLVVLVSHVEQMRQSMEDLIVLDKDPRTGDSVVVSGASVTG